MRKTNILNNVSQIKRLAIINIVNLVIKNNITINNKIVTVRNIYTTTQRSRRNLYILLRDKKYKFLLKLYHHLLYSDDIKRLVV